MPKIITTRKISSDFDIIEFLHSKGYQINRHFARHSIDINGWEVWTLHIPKEGFKYDNYAMGMKGNKFVVIDPEGEVFNRKWIGELLK